MNGPLVKGHQHGRNLNAYRNELGVHADLVPVFENEQLERSISNTFPEVLNLRE